VFILHDKLTTKGPFTRGKISADICAENCASVIDYKVTNNKFYIKTLKLAQFSAQMSALILPRVNPA
jgi:hypothetical protein